MKERPIIFNPLMARAILGGRKTQTRRVDTMRGADHVYWHVGQTHGWGKKPPQPYEGWVADVDALNGLLLPLDCPYGVPGDRLWVRECFYQDLTPSAEAEATVEEKLKSLYYRADGDCCAQIAECCCAEIGKPRWRPSIHMPRWASRLTLELTDVRVERVQDITTEDALAEGVNPRSGSDFPDPIGSFRELWESIHGANAWERNDWVWVLEFKKVMP